MWARIESGMTQTHKIKSVNYITFDRFGVLDLEFENSISTYMKSQKEQHRNHNFPGTKVSDNTVYFLRFQGK